MIDVLRVSSSYGLAPMVPEVTATATMFARDLVYLQAEKYLSTLEIASDHLGFQPIPGTGFSPETLAHALIGPGIGDVEVEGQRIIAHLKPGQHPPPIEQIALDLGPFFQSSFSPDKLVLARRSGSGIGVIELIDVGTEEEEWRRFLAREVDIVPEVRPSLVRNLSEVPSVRIVPTQDLLSTGFVFRMDRGPLTDVRLRRAISLGLRRRAIARVVVGDEAAAIDVGEDGTEAQRLIAEIKADGSEPPTLHLIFVVNSSEDQRAALVIEQQLLELGITVRLDPQSPTAGSEKLTSGHFEMFLMSAGWKPFYWRRAQTGNIANHTGYSNPDFDDAIHDKDSARAVEILRRDVPMTPLYTRPSAVAVDRRLCNTHPKDSYDLSWLADVHLCGQGETE